MLILPLLLHDDMVVEIPWSENAVIFKLWYIICIDIIVILFPNGHTAYGQK